MQTAGPTSFAGLLFASTHTLNCPCGGHSPTAPNTSQRTKPEYLPSPDSLMQLRLPVLRHVPRGCRTKCALYFSLAIHEALRSCPKTFANFWYLDDGTLIGYLASLRECMRHLIPRLAAVGSVIGTQKTHLCGPGDPESRTL